MNNISGSFRFVSVKQNPDAKPKMPFREFIFDDLAEKGSFAFKDMHLELYADGTWRFFITAEGNATTTILKNGRKTGPQVFLIFKNSTGEIMANEKLGQVNYDCIDDSVNNYICKGCIENPAHISSIEVQYDAFMDFSCRKN